MPVSPGDFLDAVRAAVQRWGGAEWIAGRVDGDDVVCSTANASVTATNPPTSSRVHG